MGTKLRRLQVQLPPELDKALAEFSEVTGIGQSRFIVDCLTQNLPTIKAIIEAKKASMSGDEVGAGKIVQKILSDLSQEAEQVLGTKKPH